jgi:Triosephosphate isomerase
MRRAASFLSAGKFNHASSVLFGMLVFGDDRMDLQFGLPIGADECPIHFPVRILALACLLRSRHARNLTIILFVRSTCSNWKANGSMAQVDQWLSTLNSGAVAGSTEVAISPPHVYLSKVGSGLRKDFGLAAQDSYAVSSSAFSGPLFDVLRKLCHASLSSLCRPPALTPARPPLLCSATSAASTPLLATASAA